MSMFDRTFCPGLTTLAGGALAAGAAAGLLAAAVAPPDLPAFPTTSAFSQHSLI